jgi:hypothetical protein
MSALDVMGDEGYGGEAEALELGAEEKASPLLPTRPPNFHDTGVGRTPVRAAMCAPAAMLPRVPSRGARVGWGVRWGGARGQAAGGVGVR